MIDIVILPLFVLLVQVFNVCETGLLYGSCVEVDLQVIGPCIPRLVSLMSHSRGFMSCLVISGFILKSNSFLVLFWIVTLLSFQVTCPSSCVTGLIVFPDSWLCPPVPSSPMCSYSLRLPSSCASVSSYVVIPALILEYCTIAIVILASCLLSIPLVEWLLFVAFCFSA